MARTLRRRGFTLIELLVVIAIIALLVGILLPALGHVRRQARNTATRAQLTAIANACEGYKLDHESYPGYFLDAALPASNLSSTENLLACLAGRLSNVAASKPAAAADYKDITGIAGGYYYDISKVGSGQVSIAGQTYGAYYTPKAEETPKILIDGVDNTIPDISDASYGMPILYFRSRPGGGLVSTYNGASVFMRAPANPYFGATLLKNPVSGREFNQASSHLRGSTTPGDDAFASAVINEKLSDSAAANYPRSGVSRGGFVLWATGPDGVYLSSKQDEPKTTSVPNTPEKIKAFDDIIVTGGTVP